ncbi:VirB2 family type IV secretion system major pilin TrwL4 [Bartonella henselae]|nr:VirB2 family type IV secretion system major pilin TrwL4 [Bartonella henselae]ATP13180.1 conjugal transfer protein [Bartonella henselae]MDM9990255.1 VirB2 family type IV secretion system major pilin TrwL4 [Bartonella henselae]MDM9997049.1 VirB2 family type IV secretion system major pilin TrwL4 [Bartonella henselae]OLL38099.1 conjugal transfer protein [Bartonella henselae]OLL43105.1 conjugal transfer protein [Bartonella henselae]
MKRSNVLQSKINNDIFAIVAIMTVFLIVNPVYAQAQTLQKAENALTALQGQLKTIIPVAAAVILLCLAIGYAGRYIEKDTFVRWGIGVVIAGSAAELVNVLFTTQ